MKNKFDNLNNQIFRKDSIFWRQYIFEDPYFINFFEKILRMDLVATKKINIATRTFQNALPHIKIFSKADSGCSRLLVRRIFDLYENKKNSQIWLGKDKTFLNQLKARKI